VAELHKDTAGLAERFAAFIQDSSFPCVGAKSALARAEMEIVEARDIRSGWDDLDIFAAVTRFAARYKADPHPFQSLAVVFGAPGRMTETAFEDALWTRLQSLADKDAFNGYLHDPRVSDDVASPHFALSLGEEAFFIVGLHPGASRPARRFERPVIVFNPHAQFETLRDQGRYEKLRDKIIERDVALAGEPNPMLAKHGEASAARQYSGREVEARWTAPFKTPGLANDN
jgi:FPC/CPF motif-containing protein YcgG